MMNKTKVLQSIRTLIADPPAEPAFITDGRWYWADGRWLLPDEITKHRGPVVQWYLASEPKPEQVPGAEMIPVDNWLQADELARATLNKEAFETETSFGYIIKSLQADDKTPMFITVTYRI
jgi:hypothetical protein